MWIILKVFTEFVIILFLCFGFFGYTPRPGIKPRPPTLEVEVSTIRLPVKSQETDILDQHLSESVNSNTA